MAAPDNDLSGTWFGEACLLEEVGRGGYGAVFRAVQPLLKREVAVKVLKQRSPQRQGIVEAQLAARVRHHGAAQIYQVGVEPDGRVWIAMEFVVGVSLAQWLRQPMPIDQFAPLFERIADVVQAAHDQGIIHRDLKPSNVMVVERGDQLFPKLLDFGLAKLLEQIDSDGAAMPDTQEASSDPAEPVTTRSPLQADAVRRPSTNVVGTPPYMGPEC